jgi:hypothetical protein
LVLPVARTERHSDMVGRSAWRSTWDQVKARSSSVLAPVSSETITYGRITVGSAKAASTSRPAWSTFSDFDGWTSDPAS